MIFRAENVFVIIKNGNKEGSTAMAQTFNPRLIEDIYTLGSIKSKIVIKIKKRCNIVISFLFLVVRITRH